MLLKRKTILKVGLKTPTAFSKEFGISYSSLDYAIAMGRIDYFKIDGRRFIVMNFNTGQYINYITLKKEGTYRREDKVKRFIKVKAKAKENKLYNKKQRKILKDLKIPLNGR